MVRMSGTNRRISGVLYDISYCLEGQMDILSRVERLVKEGDWEPAVLDHLLAVKQAVDARQKKLDAELNKEG